MKLFDVYPLYNINIVKGDGCKVWDENGTEYLDLYGGHAVISIGHAHPHYVEMISNQVANLGFYSNSVINKLQQQVAERLGKISGYEDYTLFLINSGAEANENALKLASFYNGRTKVVSFNKAFHGRTSLAVEATNNPSIIAPINNNGHVTYLPLNDVEAMKQELSKGDTCAVIIEGIQGVGGIKIPATEFMQELRKACSETGTILILDEIQSGYGRSGKFVFHIKNQPEQKVINIRQFAEQITAALFRYFQIGYFFHPLFRLFKRKIIHRLQQGCQYLKLADILFPQSGCQIRTRFVPGGYLLYFGQRDTEVQLIVDTLFAHAGGYDTVHCHAQLGTYFF